MSKESEKIDLLLEQNAADQLAGIDWNGLNTAISSRLDKAQQSKTSIKKYPYVFRVAAGLVAAAAVLLIVVMIGTDRPAGIKLEKGKLAVVKLIETQGSASVEIKRACGKSQAVVDICGSQNKAAICVVKTIELNGDLKKDVERPSWIIISKPEPVFADNGVRRDVMSMICLF